MNTFSLLALGTLVVSLLVLFLLSQLLRSLIRKQIDEQIINNNKKNDSFINENIINSENQKDINVENNDLKITFSNQGAYIKKIVLFHDKLERKN